MLKQKPTYICYTNKKTDTEIKRYFFSNYEKTPFCFSNICIKALLPAWLL